MQKRFKPDRVNSTTYELNFSNPIFNPHPGYRYAISSTSFTFRGFTCFFDDDGNGNVRIYRVVQGQRVYVNSTAGTVNYTSGLVTLRALLITAFSGDGIKVNAIPKEQNVSTVRNQILLLADATVTVINKDTEVIESKVVNAAATLKTTSSSDIGLNENSLIF